MNYDQWEIEVFFSESDYESSKNLVKRIPIFWRNKKLAQNALVEIKERDDMIENFGLDYKTLDNIGDLKRDWMVFHESGRLLQYQIAFLLDDGSRKVFSSFWDRDNFKHIEKMKIVRETFVEEGDELIF